MIYTQQEREIRNKAVKRWRLMHTEQYKEMQRKKYLKWKKKDPEHVKEVQRKAVKNYAKNHPKYWLKQYKNNRKARLASYHKHRLTHLEQVKHTVKMSKAKAKGYEGSYTLQEWKDLKKKYKFTCPKCKQKEPKIILTADHIVPLKQGGTNYITNIQPLCRPCNASKFTKTIKF